MTGWTYADVWEAVADADPDATALVHGGTRRRWRQLDRRADGVAAALLGAGLGRQATVALYLHNGPEYLESAFAAFKAGLVPVNTNYRYVGPELRHIWDDADAAAVVFHGTFTDQVRALRPALRVAAWLHVDDGTEACPEWAIPYEQAATAAADRVRAPWGRTGDDLVLIYTGGTTGHPKGVMWRQHDLYCVSNTARDPEEPDLDQVRRRLGATATRPVGLPAAPLMHGTGFVFATTVLSEGGTVVTATARRFSPVELLDTMAQEGVTALCIVGDAFCRPIVEALDGDPGRWDLSRLHAVSSAGTIWSADVKRRLLGHLPDVVLVDFLNSSEASGMGRSVTTKERRAGTGGFRLGRNAFVIDDEDRVLVEPGQVGRLAVRGHLPLGYHNDPQKTAQTFPVVDGVRCSVPGDVARIEPDGTIALLGRGSTSINTGGEKVFPEEVETALKTHAAVRDVAVVGVPDDRFGQAVAAMVELHDGAALDLAGVAAHLDGVLARYKMPRHLMVTPSIERSPNGKIDHARCTERIADWRRGATRPSDRP